MIDLDIELTDKLKFTLPDESLTMLGPSASLYEL